MSDRTRMTAEVSYQGERAQIDEVTTFDLSDDILAVGDESHLTIINEDRKYTGGLPVGASVKLYLESPRVNAGAKGLAHSGIITGLAAESTVRGGSIMKVTTADLGWHLANNCAPLWYRLTKGAFTKLIDPAAYQAGRDGSKHYLVDPSWGIKGYTTDAIKKSGLNHGRRGAQIALDIQAANDPIHVVQVEPGDTVLDLFNQHAKRKNLFITVALNDNGESYIRAWRPNYDRAPAFRIRCTSRESNIIEGRMNEALGDIFTDVECVGEQIGFEEIPDVTDPNTGKKRGAFYNRKALPFVHRRTFGDGEMVNRGLARQQAAWTQKRALHDSWYAEYQVANHWQYGPEPDRKALWWEADELCDVQDDELGIYGTFYVAAVRYQGSRSGGDVTTVTLRKKLLTPAFGELPSLVPSIKGQPKERSGGKPTQKDENTIVVT